MFRMTVETYDYLRNRPPNESDRFGRRSVMPAPHARYGNDASSRRSRFFFSSLYFVFLIWTDQTISIPTPADPVYFVAQTTRIRGDISRAFDPCTGVTRFFFFGREKSCTRVCYPHKLCPASSRKPVDY